MFAPTQTITGKDTSNDCQRFCPWRKPGIPLTRVKPPLVDYSANLPHP